MSWYEQLSGLDATFLYIEDGSAHMNVGAVTVFEGRAPAQPEVLALIASKLPQVPRYRQRLAFVPMELGRPVWIDDGALDLEHHVRRKALPAADGAAALDAFAARVFEQPLERDRPLWELWVVDGFAPDRFAVVAKTHHCMIDGVSGVDLATSLLDDRADAPAPGAPPAWKPRPAPDGAELVANALADRVAQPLDLLRGVLDPASRGRRALLELGAGLEPLARLAALPRAPESSLNAPTGPRRRWATATLDLAAVKRVRAALGGTVNDVLLAVVAGALRTLLSGRGEEPRDLRVMVPVSVRGADARGTLGNRVAAVFATLPVGEPDAVRRLHAVRAEMERLKGSGQAAGTATWTRLGDYAPPSVLAAIARHQASRRYMNLVVTNIRGPPHPLYLLGRRMTGLYPMVPLASGQTVGVAVESYDGRIGVGLLADADRARDVDVLAAAVPQALDALAAARRKHRG